MESDGDVQRMEENCLFTKFAENLKLEHNFEMCREVKGTKCKVLSSKPMSISSHFIYVVTFSTSSRAKEVQDLNKIICGNVIFGFLIIVSAKYSHSKLIT